MNVRIVLSMIVGLTMVGAAFLLAKRPENIVISAQNSPPTPIRQFIPVRDTDGNNIPDWQESFAEGTIMFSEQPQSTTTLSGQLVSSVANQLVAGGRPTNQILADLGKQLAETNLDPQYTQDDITVSGDTSVEALRNYGNRVAAIAFLEYPLPNGVPSEVDILNKAFLYNDPKYLEELDFIVTSYEDMRDAMLKTTVPATLVREHLSLINVYNALAIDIKAFRHLFEDSLTATLRFRRYPADADALYLAISNLYLKLHESGVQWEKGDTTSRFIQIEI